MSHGVVPAASSLRGPSGYFGGGLFGGRPQASNASGSDTVTAAEERQSLLHEPTASTANPSSPAAAATTKGAGSNAVRSAGATPATFDISSVASVNAHSIGGSSSSYLPRQLSLFGAGSSSSRTGASAPSPSPAARFGHGGAGGRSSTGARGGSSSSSGPRSNYESLDFEVVENTVYRTDTAARTHTDHIVKSGAKWSLCFALGLITAFAAFTVNLGVENIAGLKFWATLTLLDRGHGLAAYLVYVAINCSLVAGSVWLTVTCAPAAAGSGIAEVKAYLNGIDVPGIFLWQTLLVKLSGSVGAVAGGLAVGKEGPFVHAGACLGALLSQGGSSTHNLPWFKRFWNDRDRADLVACGTAAGVAAAFRAPVGGVLFALEEMTSWFRNQLLWYAFFTTAVVSVSVRALMRMCSAETSGSCGFFGAGGFPLYEITEGQDNFVVLELLPMLLLGVIGGLLGSCFNALNARLAGLRKARLLQHGARGRLIEGLLCALLTSTVSFLLPMMFACQPCPEVAGDACPRTDNAHSGNFVNFACPAGSRHYNDMATIFFNTQDDAIRNLFSSQTKSEYSVSTLLTFVVMFFLLAVLSYGVAIPTGLFVPSILCGAAYGRLVGVFVADMNPGSHTIDEGTYALLGAASFLGGCMRMTVATCVMLLELTNNLALLPMMMLVTLVAKAVGDGTGMRPIYESLMELKALPFLEPSPPSLMRHVTAAEAAGRPAVTFSRVERVAHILQVLRETAHNGFAVIATGPDGEQHILGMVLRSQLAVLLRSRRCFQPTSFVSEVAGRVAFSYQQSDFVRPISEAAPGIADLALTDQELAMYLDLGPYVNPSYYVVQEDTSLAKVYTLFRSLGLRHLAVIPRASSVVGVITRQDLLPGILEETCLEQLTLGAGAAGLASALRGTVRDAVDAYQHQANSSPAPSLAAVSPAAAMSPAAAEAAAAAVGPAGSKLMLSPVAATAVVAAERQQQQQPPAAVRSSLATSTPPGRAGGVAAADWQQQLLQQNGAANGLPRSGGGHSSKEQAVAGGDSPPQQAAKARPGSGAMLPGGSRHNSSSLQPGIARGGSGGQQQQQQQQQPQQPARGARASSGSCSSAGSWDDFDQLEQQQQQLPTTVTVGHCWQQGGLG